MLFTSYNTSTSLFLNVIVGPRRRVVPGVTMAEPIFSNFTIKKDNGSKISTQKDSLREISKYYSRLTHFITPVFTPVSP